MVVFFIGAFWLQYAQGSDRKERRLREQFKGRRGAHVHREEAYMCVCARVPICMQFCECVLFLLPPSVPSALTAKHSSNVLSNKPMIIISVQY